jgi:glyoxylase-like metal-dependent hydrolase (beta-lactamase superfamily II)
MHVNESIEAIDCHYGGEQKCSAYLMVEGDRAVFVDNNTNSAVPYLLDALARRGIPRENVDYAIITHVHLDHAGGTATLLDACPNATVLAHPKAARHLISPDRLIAGSIAVYGEDHFHQLYGEIRPVAEDRVISVEDEGTLVWAGRRLRFLHTPGHASHHFCIHDERTKTIFTGDSFGIGRSTRLRPGPPFLICSTTPADFDAPAARLSLRRILETGAETACIGHYGPFDDLELGAKQIMRALMLHEAIQFSAAESGFEGAELQAFCIDSVRKVMEPFLVWCGVEDVKADLDWIGGDIALNGMGLAIAAQRLRKKEAAKPVPQN